MPYLKNSLFIKHVKHMCYTTGQSIFEVKQNLSAVLDEYNIAYKKLYSTFNDFQSDWETLGDDFYA